VFVCLSVFCVICVQYFIDNLYAQMFFILDEARAEAAAANQKTVKCNALQ